MAQLVPRKGTRSESSVLSASVAMLRPRLAYRLLGCGRLHPIGGLDRPDCHARQRRRAQQQCRPHHERNLSLHLSPPVCWLSHCWDDRLGGGVRRGRGFAQKSASRAATLKEMATELVSRRERAPRRPPDEEQGGHRAGAAVRRSARAIVTRCFAAAGRLGETIETPQQRGLTRARGANQDERAAPLYPDRHVFEDGGRELAAGSSIRRQA